LVPVKPCEKIWMNKRLFSSVFLPYLPLACARDRIGAEARDGCRAYQQGDGLAVIDERRGNGAARHGGIATWQEKRDEARNEARDAKAQ
jgi:hypothetical protein